MGWDIQTTQQRLIQAEQLEGTTAFPAQPSSPSSSSSPQPCHGLDKQGLGTGSEFFTPYRAVAAPVSWGSPSLILTFSEVPSLSFNTSAGRKQFLGGFSPDGPTFYPAKMPLSPLPDIQEQDVHISDKHSLEGLTHLLHTPDLPHPSPREGSGKIPGKCWALAWIQGFTASLGSLYSRGRENTQLMALSSYTHSQSSGSSARCLLKPLRLTEFYSLSAPG